jgi:hypothetical protein
MQALYIISGGQTGVDRAALDFAMKYRFPCGGYCPKGRIAEDGFISLNYPLTETSGSFYQERTRLNIKESEATLIFIADACYGKGTLFTYNLCKKMKVPFLVIDLTQDFGYNISACCEWLKHKNFCKLNIAGNRESTSPGIYRLTSSFLSELLVSGAIIRLP